MAVVTMPKIKTQGKVTFSEERSKQNVVDTLATVFAGQTSRTAESQSYRRWLPGKSNVGRILLHDNGSQDRLLGMKVSGIGKAQRRTAAFLDQQQKTFVNRLQKKQDTWVREHSRRALALNQMGPKKRQNQTQEKEERAAPLAVSPNDIVIEEKQKKESRQKESDSLPKIGKPGNLIGSADQDSVPAGFRNQRGFQRFPQIKRPDEEAVEKTDQEKQHESVKAEETPRTADAAAPKAKKRPTKEASTETCIGEALPRIRVGYPGSKGRRKISRKCSPPSAGATDPINDDRFHQLTASLVCTDVKKNEIRDVGALIAGIRCGNRYLKEFKKRWKKKNTQFKTDIDEFYLT